ncbi:hypothetical protein DACRYDRAFT_20551 [Dacryopinax primogenitus]|uniref:Uncharacterized protein n=1 Tax=Dacryopinax primogenitus (strain DJM 731) TaxID=1858805 RepID=M5GE08_DACPD|nr:uncharacterized protein DACRYDRAFT_20551 [Dacryopinax primogenitus]EJU04982.1 hypothetical protein DACRYDRAFT_20551 [Dacryopinax primogenitus]
MYKRVAKRIERHEREEKLGITEEEKEILGLQDTDTDESESSDSDEGSDKEDAEGFEVGSELDEMDERPQENGDDETDSDDDESLSDIVPAVTVEQALKSPLYTFLGDTKTEGCFVCPGKFLASRNASELHVKSSSHKRRFRRFQAYVDDAQKKGDALAGAEASEIVQKMDADRPPPPERITGAVQPKGPKPPNRKMRREALRKAKEVEVEETKAKNGDKVAEDREATTKAVNEGGVKAAVDIPATKKEKKTAKEALAKPNAFPAAAAAAPHKRKRAKDTDVPISTKPKKQKTKPVAA